MSSGLDQSVVAVIWSFNPKIERFTEVLRSIIEQVDRVVLVDNGSSNIEQIRNVCGSLRSKDKITLLELKINSGVHALNLGMKYACDKFNPTWVLLLDHDTVVYPGAISKILAKSSIYTDKIGALCMSSEEHSNEKRKCELTTFRYSIFSGCLINARLINQGVKIREDFFLDQADFDFFDKIRRQGFLTLIYLGEKLVDHELGIPFSIPIKLPLVGVIRTYEPTWRYYYIVRNSTVLLIERKMDIVFYLRQLIAYAIPLVFREGLIKTLKTLTLALAHGLSRKLGYFNPKML